jgi:hypothetical protein
LLLDIERMKTAHRRLANQTAAPAFLEVAESAFRPVLPDIEPDAFSCGIAEPEFKMKAYGGGGRARLNSRRCHSIGVFELPQNPVTDITAGAERRAVTSEVAGSSPVVPAIPFQYSPNLFQIFAAMCRDSARDGTRHQPPRNAPNTRVEL